jgi:NAD(P)H-dependent FMN reductase
MKLVAFAASNSNQSINKQLVTHAAGLLSGDAGHLSWRAR